MYEYSPAPPPPPSPPLKCGAPDLAGFTPNFHCHTSLDGGLQKYEITRGYGAYILPSVSQKCAIDGQV
jgi:hypothetical protein